jgi:transcriptional regulator with XRE-family HTH domain
MKATADGRSAGELTPEAAAHGAPLARLVRQVRMQRRLTQEELADASGLSVRSIRNLESGAVKTPRRATRRRIAEALGLNERQRRALDSVAGDHALARASSGSARPADLRMTPTRPHSDAAVTVLVDGVAAAERLFSAQPGTLVAVLMPASYVQRLITETSNG